MRKRARLEGAYGEEFRANLREAYENGATIRELARKHGVYNSRIHWNLNKAGTQFRPKIEKKKGVYGFC